MSIMSVEARYYNDPLFHSLVEQMYNMIVTLHATPTEIREAAMLAQMKFEMFSQNRLTFFNDSELQQHYKKTMKL